MRLPRSPIVLSLALAAGSLSAGAFAAPAADPDDPEGVGNEMGYRMYGAFRKDRPILLQNSRPVPVQVFQEGKGTYITIPPFSDREFDCEGRVRVLHVRFVDSFGESVPFQVRVSCGRELQFIAKEQTRSAQPGVAVPANSDDAPPEDIPVQNPVPEHAEQSGIVIEDPVQSEAPPEAAPTAPAAEELPPFLSPP